MLTVFSQSKKKNINVKAFREDMRNMDVPLIVLNEIKQKKSGESFEESDLIDISIENILTLEAYECMQGFAENLKFAFVSNAFLEACLEKLILTMEELKNIAQENVNEQYVLTLENTDSSIQNIGAIYSALTFFVDQADEEENKSKNSRMVLS